MSELSAGTLPAIDSTAIPAAIRNGDKAAKSAYQVGLAFEQMLVGELSQQLSATAADDGSGGDSSGQLGSDAGAGAFTSMVPDALSSGVMSAGGLGIAAQIAGAIDPAIKGKV